MPRVAKSHTAKPRSAEPGAGETRGARARATKPQGAEPRATSARAAEPSAVQPSAARPNAARSENGESNLARSENGEPVIRDADGESVARDVVSRPGPDGRPQRTTRRFPRITRDTARPEGGGRAASGDAPAPARQWPMLTVASTVGLGLLITAFDAFRFGTLLVGLGLLAGGVLRWTLPGVGMLAVRSRFTDLVTYGVLGVTIVLLAMMAQPSPWLEIPFLDDALHFTIRT